MPNLELLLKQLKGLGLLAMDKRYLWSVGEEQSEFLKSVKFWTIIEFSGQKCTSFDVISGSSIEV